MPEKFGPIKYYREFSKILRTNQYQVIHFHTSFQSCIGLYIARKNKIPIRICHSHTSEVQRDCNKVIKKLLLPICKRIIKRYSTDFVACSEEAAKNLFTNNTKYQVIYNGLDINELKSVNDNNSNIIKEKICDGECIGKKIIGQVGRFSDMKNPAFTINLARKMNQEKNVFVFLGDGKLFDDIKKSANGLKNVKFMGRVDNVNEYMAIFDYLLLPSKFGEGLPVVLIEQQIINHSCECIANDNVTREANLGNVKYISISQIDEWIKEINTPKTENKTIDVKKFDINQTAPIWLSLYER